MTGQHGLDQPVAEQPSGRWLISPVCLLVHQPQTLLEGASLGSGVSGLLSLPRQGSRPQIGVQAAPPPTDRRLGQVLGGVAGVAPVCGIDLNITNYHVYFQVCFRPLIPFSVQ